MQERIVWVRVFEEQLHPNEKGKME